MASRFWVGGTGTWDTTSTTNWSATSGGAAGASAPTTADTVTFDSLSGTGTCTTAAGATCSTLTKNSSTLGLTLGADMTVTGTVTLTLGNIALNSFILTCSIFSSSGTLARSVSFGTGNITVTGNNAIVVAMTTATNFTSTGTRRIYSTYSGSVGTRSFTIGGTAGGTATSALSINITAGSDIVSMLGAYLDTIYTGFSGSLANAGRSVFGTFTLSPTMTVTSGTSQSTFAGTSGTQLITTNGVAYNQPINQGGIGGTVQFQDAFTSNQTYTLSNGVLDLNGFTLTCSIFSSAIGNVRSILFGTANITITGSATTVLNMASATNFSYTGTPTINCTYSGSTGTRTLAFGTTSGATAANVLNINVIAGSDTVIPSGVKSLDFTGFSGIYGAGGITKIIYGDLTLSPTMTIASGITTNNFSATSGTQLITTNGVIFQQPIVKVGVGGTLKMQDALTCTQRVTLTSGTLDLNNVSLTCLEFFSNNSNVRALINGSGGITVTGLNWSTPTITNFSFYPINLTWADTSITTKTFATGGLTFGDILFTGSNIYQINITGNPTFGTVANTKTSAITITLAASSTVTTTNWNVSGTVGNIVTLNSATSGTQATISQVSGLVDVRFCNIQDNNATGGATFTASISNGNTDLGNNTGWNFAAATASIIAELTTLTELISALLVSADNVDESQTLTDAQLGALTTSNAISETETLTHTQTASLAVNVALSETETLTDNLIGGLLFTAVVAETETLTSTESTRITAVGAVAETTTLSEAQAGTFIFLSSVTELQVITDTQTGLAIYRSVIAENQIITDTQLGNMIYPSVLNETQTLTDIYTGQRSLYYDVTETTTLTNTQSATYLFAGNIVEPVDLTTTQDAIAIFNSTQNELMLITDSSFGRGWFKVADGQTPDWQNINDAQGTGWVNINDSNDAVWIPVDDKQ